MFWKAVIASVAMLSSFALADGSVLNSYGKVRVAPAIAGVLAILVGGLICFYGYRLLRFTIFLCGFMVAGLVAALVVELALGSLKWMPTVSWIAFLVAGIAGGSLAVYAYALGVFLVGALAGLLVAFVLQTSFAYQIFPSHPEVILIVLIVLLGLIGGALTWRLEKPMLILATSYAGAVAFIWGIGCFTGKYPNGAALDRFRTRNMHGDWVYAIPGAWWAYLTAMLLMFVIGVWVQWRCTSKGVRHRSIHDRCDSEDNYALTSPAAQAQPMARLSTPRVRSPRRRDDK